jgi:hypothetical protein
MKKLCCKYDIVDKLSSDNELDDQLRDDLDTTHVEDLYMATEFKTSPSLEHLSNAPDGIY